MKPLASPCGNPSSYASVSVGGSQIVFLGSFNEAIFNGINGLVGTFIGIIIGRKV